jgi:hypothetical protein
MAALAAVSIDSIGSLSSSLSIVMGKCLCAPGRVPGPRGFGCLILSLFFPFFSLFFFVATAGIGVVETHRDCGLGVLFLFSFAVRGAVLERREAGLARPIALLWEASLRGFLDFVRFRRDGD